MDNEQHEFRVKVLTELSRINAKIDSHTTESKVEWKSVRKEVSDTNRTLHGNGQPGLVSQVNTLMSERNLMRWLVGISIAGIAAVAAAAGVILI